MTDGMNSNKLPLKRIFITAVFAIILLILLWLVTALALFSAPLLRPVTPSLLDFWLIFCVAPLSFWFDFLLGDITYSLAFHRYDSWLTVLTILLSLSYLGIFAGMVHRSITADLSQIRGNPAEVAAKEFWLRYRWLLIAVGAVFAYYIILTSSI